MKTLILSVFASALLGVVAGGFGMQWHLTKNHLPVVSVPVPAPVPEPKPWEKDGAAVEMQPGIFTIISAGEHVYKLDTVTGKAWMLITREHTPKGRDFKVSQLVWANIYEDGIVVGKDGRNFTVGTGMEVESAPNGDK